MGTLINDSTDWFHLRQTQVLELTSVSAQTIKNWIKGGLKFTVDSITRQKVYNIEDLVRYLVEYRRMGKNPNEDGGTIELKNKILKLDAELKTIKVDSQKENLVDVNLLNDQWIAAGNKLRDKLERVSTNHPAAGPAIREAINQCIKELGINLDQPKGKAKSGSTDN